MKHYFLRLSASTVIILFLMLILSGCSIFGNGEKVESLSLTAYQMTDSLNKGNWPSEWRIEQIDNEPYLYRIRVKENDDKFSPAYSVLLKECGIGKNASANATTRQLLVGLKDIQTLREEDFLYNDKRIFYKQSNAKLDEHDIKLSTFTLREDNCVYDTVIWSDDSQPGSVMAWFGGAETDNLRKIYFAFSHT